MVSTCQRAPPRCPAPRCASSSALARARTHHAALQPLRSSRSSDARCPLSHSRDKLPLASPPDAPPHLCLPPPIGYPRPAMIREVTFFPELTRPYGLTPCGPIRDLGRIVILVGAAGAGKSRYLRL